MRVTQLGGLTVGLEKNCFFLHEVYEVKSDKMWQAVNGRYSEVEDETCWINIQDPYTKSGKHCHTVKWTDNDNEELQIFWEKTKQVTYKYLAIPLHAMEALGGRGGIAPTHSRPRH
jgi:hypothetical protein